MRGFDFSQERVVAVQEARAGRVGGAGELPGDFRALGAWYGVEFLNSYAATLLTAGCYDYVARSLGASASTALWLCAGWGFVYIFIALWAGKVARTWGPRKSVLVMAAASVATALLGLMAIAVPSVWTVLAIMLPYNWTSTTIWPAIESGLSRTRARPGGMGLSARMALFNVSWGSAGFAAFFTRGALESAGWHWVFIVTAAAHALAWVILKFGGAPPALIGDGHVTEEEETPEERAVQPARARRLLTMARLANALAYVSIYVLIPLLSKLAVLANMGSLVDAGMVTSAWSFTRFVGFGIMWVWVGWHYRARWLVGAMLVLAASLFVTLTVHQAAVLVGAQILFGLSTALVYSSALYYAMHVSHGDGGQAGLHEALIGLGIFIGPAIGAVSGAGNVGVEAMQRIGLGVTGLLVIGVLVMMALARKNEDGPAPEEQST